MDFVRCTAMKKIGTDEEQRVFSRSNSNMDLYIELACNAAFASNPTGGKCPRCKQRTVTVELVQTRAADEGMTAIATCQSCKHTWVAN